MFICYINFIQVTLAKIDKYGFFKKYDKKTLNDIVNQRTVDINNMTLNLNSDAADIFGNKSRINVVAVFFRKKWILFIICEMKYV